MRGQSDITVIGPRKRIRVREQVKFQYRSIVFRINVTIQERL